MRSSGIDLIAAQRSAIIDSAKEEGLCASIASRLAERAERKLRSVVGGRTHYIKIPDKSERNSEIKTRFFRGSSLVSLAVEYGLTENRIRQIVS